MLGVRVDGDGHLSLRESLCFSELNMLVFLRNEESALQRLVSRRTGAKVVAMAALFGLEG